MADRGSGGESVAPAPTPIPSPSTCAGLPLRVCRFCQGTNDQLCMVTPCHCKGELGYAHANCVTSQVYRHNLYFCPVCRYDFVIRWEQQKSFREWLLSDETSDHQRRLLCNVALAVSMAVVLVLAWLQAARTLAGLPRFIAFVAAIFLMLHTASWIGYASYNFCLSQKRYVLKSTDRGDARYGALMWHFVGMTSTSA